MSKCQSDIHIQAEVFHKNKNNDIMVSHFSCRFNSDKEKKTLKILKMAQREKEKSK